MYIPIVTAVPRVLEPVERDDFVRSCPLTDPRIRTESAAQRRPAPRVTRATPAPRGDRR